MALGGALGRAWASVTAAALCVAGVAQPHIHLSFHVAGVAQTHIYCRFAWQAWNRWHLGGALGRAWAPVTPRHFVWQAWHNLTSTFVPRGRRGTDGTGWRAWTGLGAWDAGALYFVWQAWHKLHIHLSFHVAGVAQTHIYCRFAWQSWDRWHLGGALGRAWAPVSPRHFAWQAWHTLTSTVVSRGRRGTNSHLLSFSRGRRGTDGTGWRAWTGLGACDAAALCVAGVAQTHIYCRFAWRSWDRWHWVGRLDGLGRL